MAYLMSHDTHQIIAYPLKVLLASYPALFCE